MPLKPKANARPDAPPKPPRPHPWDAAPEALPFWKRKSMAQMTAAEWESLCDGCGKCCLVKLTDADDTRITYFTDVGCTLLDGDSCRCSDYAHRLEKVKDCVKLTPRNIRRIVWLPPSCAYRLVAEGRDLYWWHPLVSGDPETVHAAGVSVRGRVGAREDAVREDEFEHRIVDWPLKLPKAARSRG
jgi:uncharacterized cysteine cluster protein YcgN (CxxCxxCC family)